LGNITEALKELVSLKIVDLNFSMSGLVLEERLIIFRCKDLTDSSLKSLSAAIKKLVGLEAMNLTFNK